MKFSAALLTLLPALAYAQDSSSASASEATPSASASAAAPSGSQDFATGLVAALNAAGLTTLASLITPLAPVLGPILESGDHTVFAPTNGALSGVDTSNATALQQILEYHVVYGSYPAADITANNTVAAVLLSGAPAVNLPSGAPQAISFYKDQFGTTRIVGQNTSVLANATYQNVLVKVIDNVLMVPPPIPAVLSNEANATALVSAVSAIAPDLVSALNTTAGLTVFAPSNDAVSAVESTLTQVAGSDPSAVASVIQGHVLNQVVYSTNITNGLSAATLNGGQLSLAVNSTGVFVTSNGATAQVIATDYIAANGVVHIIDAVLFNPSSAAASGSASASGAASSVAESASSAAASASASA